MASRQLPPNSDFFFWPLATGASDGNQRERTKPVMAKAEFPIALDADARARIAKIAQEQGVDIADLEIDLYDIDDVEEVVGNLRQLADMAHRETL